MPVSSSRLRLLAVAVVAGVALTGCSGADGDDAGRGDKDAGPAKSTNTVQIKDFKYIPANITVKAGTVVTWTNADSAPHTATASDKSFDSGNFEKGESYSYTFSKPGTYEYICTLHQYMKGKVTVT